MIRPSLAVALCGVLAGCARVSASGITTTPSTSAPVVASATTVAAVTTTDVVLSTTTAVAPAVRSGANVNQVDAVGEPIGLTIPSIGVDTPLTPVGVLDDGTVAVPPDPSIAGWFTGGPRPGALGPAMIMGHVDSKKSGPGVFWRLGDLDVGDEAVVHTTSGDVRFVVTEREQVAKDSFPTGRVYGPVPERALRLITCGGSFDRNIGHYRDNIVVYLVEAAP